MLGRLIRILPLAAAGWRMYQNRRRRNAAQDPGTQPPR